MNWLKRIFSRNQIYSDLQQEMQEHIDERAAELSAGGMEPEEALRKARREFGNKTLLEEQGREVWQWPALENLWRDLRLAFRRLGKVPGLTVVCVLTLALGLGASVALFSVVQAVLLKPLPFKDPGRLVMLYESDGKNSQFSFNEVSAGNFTEWQRDSHSFEQMAFWGWTARSLSNPGGQLPEEIQAKLCTWNLWGTLGVQPAYGRNFSASDDTPQANAVTILSWGLFQRRFGGDPAILGKTVLLDDKPYTVIGVLPGWFTYPDSKSQLWLPAFHEQAAAVMRSHGMHKWNVVARLKSGVTDTQARSDVNAIQGRIHRQYPNEPAMGGAQLRPLIDDMVHDFKTPLYVLLGAVGCVLLITCLNVANLLAARAAARRKELSIRSALGGSGWRMIQEQMAESVILASGGSLLGVILASAAIQWLVSVRNDLPRAETVHIDLSVLLFAFAITFLSALIAGLLPATLLPGSLMQALQESSRSVSSNRSQARLRKTLLGIEVAFTVILLIGAGLLVKSFFQLRSIPTGCTTKNVLTMSFSLPKVKYNDPAQKTSFFEELTNRVRSLPGVEDAGLITTLPGGGHGSDDVFTIPENAPLPKDRLQSSIDRGIGPTFLTTMQIPLLRGRNFTDAERLSRAHFVIVSQAFSKEFFRHEDPLGKHISVTAWGTSYEIIGVVGDTPYLVSQPIRPMMYFPQYEGSLQYSGGSLVIRSAVDPMSLALPIQKQIAQMDPNLAVANILTMNQVIGQSTAAASFNTYLLLGFAGLSLLLAAMGLYGVLSYVVTQRTNEMGIRIALGAQRGELLRLMLLDGLKPALIGVAFGLIGGIGAARLIRSMLFGVHPEDLSTFVAVPIILLAVAAVACLMPALRASNTDPIQALRME